MSYAVRNTLFIAAFWAIALIGGSYYIYGVQSEEHNKLLIENKQKTQRVHELQNMQTEMNKLLKYYNHLRDTSLSKMGALAENESPGETFDYILRELLQTNSSLQVNLKFVKQDSFNTLMRRIYEINGEGKFTDFYNMLWFLENGPIYYDIKSVTFEKLTAEKKSKSKSKSESRFNMLVWGFNRKEGLNMIKLTRKKGEPIKIASLISNKGYSPGTIIQSEHNIESDKSSNLIISSKSKRPVVNEETEILAITPNSFLIRANTGQTLRLKMGDKIKGGVVKQIDVQNGRIVLSLLKDGMQRTKMLSIRRN